MNRVGANMKFAKYVFLPFYYNIYICFVTTLNCFSLPLCLLSSFSHYLYVYISFIFAIFLSFILIISLSLFLLSLCSVCPYSSASLFHTFFSLSFFSKKLSSYVLFHFFNTSPAFVKSKNVSRIKMRGGIIKTSLNAQQGNTLHVKSINVNFSSFDSTWYLYIRW